MEEASRSGRKHRAILEAASTVFLRNGYLGTSMDEIAALAQVSKQTVYKHFADKESLFTAVVTVAVDAAGDPVTAEATALADSDDLEADLLVLARDQLGKVMQPHLMRLRRLVIGEAGRFPELGRAPDRARAAPHARSTARCRPLQLAGHGGAGEPRDAARRRGDPERGRARPLRRGRRARLPRRLRLSQRKSGPLSTRVSCHVCLRR